MKRLSSFLFILMAIVSASTIFCHENNIQSTWQEIKKFEKSLKHKMHSLTITGSWNEYHRNERQKDGLFDALIYAEAICKCKNDSEPTLDCQKTLLKPLLISYIDVALKQTELTTHTYFEANNQEKYIEYVNYLKKQKEHYIDIKEMPIREC